GSEVRGQRSGGFGGSPIMHCSRDDDDDDDDAAGGGRTFCPFLRLICIERRTDDVTMETL
ncbi:Hypothetical predicted protein, partial [Scomber scombrus]